MRFRNFSSIYPQFGRLWLARKSFTGVGSSVGRIPYFWEEENLFVSGYWGFSGPRNQSLRKPLIRTARGAAMEDAFSFNHLKGLPCRAAAYQCRGESAEQDGGHEHRSCLNTTVFYHVARLGSITLAAKALFLRNRR